MVVVSVFVYIEQDHILHSLSNVQNSWWVADNQYLKQKTFIKLLLLPELIFNDILTWLLAVTIANDVSLAVAMVNNAHNIPTF